MGVSSCTPKEIMGFEGLNKLPSATEHSGETEKEDTPPDYERLSDSDPEEESRNLDEETLAIPDEESGRAERYEARRKELEKSLELQRPIIEEARRMRTALLEERGLFPMSKEDFYTYFSSGDSEFCVDVRQQNVGNCQEIASIYAMSLSPHFEVLCRSSMERLPDGSWRVKVPLMSEEGETIVISPQELLPQWNKQFLKHVERDGVRKRDWRLWLSPVQGKEGLRVLEAAFMKARFGSVDRHLADEVGLGAKALSQFGGKNFIRYSVSSYKAIPGQKKLHILGLGSMGEVQQAHLDVFLENLNPEVHIATAATMHDMEEVFARSQPRGTAVPLVSGHAYAVVGFDRDRKAVALVNPWDTSKTIELALDQFKKYFYHFEAVRIDNAKLLESMKALKERSLEL